MSTGWELRLGILRQDAEEKLLAPLRTHGWTATIEREVEQGEYLVVKAERAGVEHRVAIMYTSATANTVYKALASQVEHIFIKGELYKLESYAYGITTPVSTADDFHGVLIDWNNASATGKFAPNTPAAPIAAHPPMHRTLLSEEPIEAIWLRLRQLTSVTLARKLVATRAANESVPLDDEVVRTKAEGLAFSLRNASDYFKTRDGQNVSQRVLNLYYGSMAFAFAEMLATPKGPASLADIEKITTQGHGLCTLDGEQDGLERVVVSTVASGFFASWMKFLGIPTDSFPSKKPKTYADLTKQPESSWLTVEALFARIPEVADLFLDIFSSKPAWITPTYDQEANPDIDIEFPEGSKANRLRAFLRSADASRVALTLEALLEHRGARDGDDSSSNLVKVKNLIARLRKMQVAMSPVMRAVDVLSLAYVHELETKIDQRLTAADLEGAITAARTMLEAVLVELEKQLAGTPGDYKGDLPEQFKAVAKQLRIDDERADLDDNFKQVARGLVQVVNGLAPIRNKMSDGHARERKPEVHHARVIVNAAKTVATFLVESYLVQRERGLLTGPTNSLNNVAA